MTGRNIQGLLLVMWPWVELLHHGTLSAYLYRGPRHGSTATRMLVRGDVRSHDIILLFIFTVVVIIAVVVVVFVPQHGRSLERGSANGVARLGDFLAFHGGQWSQ